MNHVQDRLPDYLMNMLDRSARAEIDAHLQDCALCREEYDTLLRLWARLGTLPEPEPSEMLRTRFAAMLEAYQEGLRHAPPARGFIAAINGVVERFWPTQPAVQFALSLALLLAGAGIGSGIGGASDRDAELASLRGEVQHLGRLLTVSLLNQQSASERLRGVAWTLRINHADGQVLHELLRALKYDPNVNVRLAAIDALARYMGDPEVFSEMLEALRRETSPLVQIALIDAFVSEGIGRSKPILEDLMKNPAVDATVKRRIEAAISELPQGPRS